MSKFKPTNELRMKQTKFHYPISGREGIPNKMTYKVVSVLQQKFIEIFWDEDGEGNTYELETGKEEWRDIPEVWEE